MLGPQANRNSEQGRLPAALPPQLPLPPAAANPVCDLSHGDNQVLSGDAPGHKQAAPGTHQLP